MQHVPEVIVLDFRKSEAKPTPERTSVRFGKSVIPPVLFLQGTAADESSAPDALFMKPLLADRIHSLRIED